MNTCKTLMFSIQKGGVAKTTTTAMMSHMMANENNKVLLIDFDPQANLSEMMLDIESNEFVNRSILEAIYKNNITKYIYTVSDQIDIVPATNFLSTFEKLVYTSKTYDNKTIAIKNSPYLLLDNILEQVRSKYNYILIDTPPSLGAHMLNALCASDYVIALFSPGRFSLSALPNFCDTVEEASKISKHNLELVGILPTMCDKRRIDIKTYLEILEHDPYFKKLIFKNIVPFRAANARLSTYGINANPEISELENLYKSIYEELQEKIKNIKLKNRKNG